MYELVVWDRDDDSQIPLSISDEKYHLFLDLCFQYADFFSLNRAPWTNSIFTELQERLSPFFVKRVLSYNWFGYDYTEVSPEDAREIEVFIYRADEGAKNIFKEMFIDIFLNESEGESNQNLEDLCFISNGRFIVGTVSHASLLQVSSRNKSFVEKLQMFGKWNHISDNTPQIVVNYPSLNADAF